MGSVCHERIRVSREIMATVPGVEKFAELLRKDGFRGDVETDTAAGVVYGTDNSIYQLCPVAVVVPSDADDVRLLARLNHHRSNPYALVARGGGTGTNGQSLTNGIVVDTRRRMNRILSIDPDARTAVVQPGVVLGELNAELASFGLMFAPHVSTGSRATIGGMVSTDAAGKGSLVHGRTNRHVDTITTVLADGTSWTFAALTPGDVDSVAGRGDRIGDLHRHASDAVTGLDRDVFPDVPRGFSGYNLADAIVGDDGDEQLDLTKVLCGSEGTLAIITEVTVRLTPVGSNPHLAVLAYKSFDEAIREANRLKVASPIAIECLDERTISLAGASPAFGRFAALLDSALDTERSSLLLMEFDGAAGVERLRALDPIGAGATALAVTADAADIAAVWKVRADAVGLLGQSVGGRRSVAFVEDCAVPPNRLVEFVAEFRNVLDRHGLTYGMFGHADVGCLHVRPALDLYDERQEALVRTISDEVADLVSNFGGVLWGEHGRGFRGEFLDLDDDTMRRMRAIKTAFDPRNVLNPGKLYAPLDVDTPIVRIDEVPLRIHRDRRVAEAHRDHYASAFACNGNGICHHWGEAEVMCPSFKATLDPRLSPKGRADLLRAWSADPANEALAHDLADSMRQCLSCGACTGRCPVQVDIPEMKSSFLEHYGERSMRRRARDAVLSRFESSLPTLQRLGRAGNPLQRVVRPVLVALGVVDLPAVPEASLSNVLTDLDVAVVGPTSLTGSTASAGDDVTVIVMLDVFSAFMDPDVLRSTLVVLQAVGERPGVSPFVPSGKFDHVTGRRRRFARAAQRQRRALEAMATHGVPLVLIEPAVSLMGAHEYPAIDPAFPLGAVTSLADYLAPRLAPIAVKSQHGHAQLFGHCTEVSLAPERTAAYRSMLETAGYSVMVEATTCCGMAGIFGHEVEHRDMSARLFDSGWRQRLDKDGPDVRCASGYSCRSQANRFGHTLLHPVQVLARQL